MKHTVTLRPFDIEFECDERETILAAALRSGISLRYGCKHGNCGSCKAMISSGIVDQDDASEAALLAFERDAGLSLLCSAYPVEDIVIDLADDYTQEELTSAPPIGEYRAVLGKLDNLTHDIAFLQLDLQAPPAMHFNAGQYVEVQIPGTQEWRAFSMANSASQDRKIELIVKLLSGGAMGNYVRNVARAGDEIAVRGPYGQFTVSQSTAPIVMVAGGSGMAPIASMLGWLANQRSDREITFFYGARAKGDLFWSEQLSDLTGRLAKFRYVPALSEPKDTDDWTGERGLVTDVLERTCGSLRGSEGYLCGPPGMIDAAIAILKTKGMFSSRIRFDKFVSTQTRN